MMLLTPVKLVFPKGGCGFVLFKFPVILEEKHLDRLCV